MSRTWRRASGQTPMSYEEFFRERQEARYGSAQAGGCCLAHCRRSAVTLYERTATLCWRPFCATPSPPLLRASQSIRRNPLPVYFFLQEFHFACARAPARRHVDNFARSSLYQKLTIMSPAVDRQRLLWSPSSPSPSASVLNAPQTRPAAVFAWPGSGANSAGRPALQRPQLARPPWLASREARRHLRRRAVRPQGQALRRYWRARARRRELDEPPLLDLSEEAHGERTEASRPWLPRMRLYRPVAGAEQALRRADDRSRPAPDVARRLRSLGVMAARWPALLVALAAGAALAAQHRRPDREADQRRAEGIGQPELHAAHPHERATNWAP
jgi:hypothetical protein